MYACISKLINQIDDVLLIDIQLYPFIIFIIIYLISYDKFLGEKFILMFN